MCQTKKVEDGEIFDLFFADAVLMNPHKNLWVNIIKAS